MTSLTNKHILLGVTGGIAAYKSAELVRRLQDEGADVRVVMTSAATAFITPLTMQALSTHPVHLDLMDSQTESVMGHIELARWADMILVAPATADFIARFVFGHGDDLLTTICLAATCPVTLAPAMNQAMWAKQNTQANMASLASMGVTLLAPGEGMQACGETGPGRLMEVADIVSAVAGSFPTSLLSGKHVVITAGPTREAIDPVRYISNYSSGKQGYALAGAALEAGARVTLISGPTHLPCPERARLINVVSADEMFAAVMDSIGDADVFIGVAAVADYKPAAPAPQKIKKQGDASLTLKLVQNSDILAAVASHPAGPFTVGFAAETENLVNHARAKLADKSIDMIVANDVADPEIGFNSELNEMTVITSSSHASKSANQSDLVQSSSVQSNSVQSNSVQSLPRMSKHALARKLITLIATAITS